VGFVVLTIVTDEGIGPAELGVALEERGFESLFVAEHSHIPVDTKTPYPLGGPIPPKYYRTLDPFVALTAAAVVIQRLVVGTGIALVSQRDPIQTAKEVASLDLVSDGRLRFGVVSNGYAKRSPITVSIPRCADGRSTNDWARSSKSGHAKGGISRRSRRLRSHLQLAEAVHHPAPANLCRRRPGQLQTDGPPGRRLDLDEPISASPFRPARRTARYRR
jgi:luciferase-like monooxygenase